jgi:hypothetical protein
MVPFVLDAPAAPTPAVKARPGRRWALLAAGLLVVLVLSHVPAFVCLPPDADVCEWDLCARSVLAGKVFYREAFENNFPGMLWLHLAVRSVVGWSSPAFAAVDLAVVAVIIGLLVGWLPAGTSAAGRLAAAGVLAAFYLSTSEWCHGQRDTWMLLPALVALGLRDRQVLALGAPVPRVADVAGRALADGLCWALAFWIKPFAAVPALASWLCGAGQVRRMRQDWHLWVIRDGAFWVLGGLAGGLAGCAWLAATGAWSSFWEVMAWNRQYVVHDISGGQRALIVAGFLVRLSPWLLVHLAAVPLAWRAWRRGGTEAEAAAGRLLAALYLGWLAQAVLLQHLYDYVHVPALLLALTIVCRQLALWGPGPARTALAALVLVGVAVRLPGLTLQRLEVWPRCLREGSSAALRDRLSLLPRASWADLAFVQAFLRAQNVGDGELTCYSMRTLPVYLELGVEPSTRWFLLENVLVILRQQRALVLAELAASRQRYFLCDLETTSWKPGRGPGEPGFARDRLVYRAGRYAVFQVDAAAMPAWFEEYLDP